MAPECSRGTFHGFTSQWTTLEVSPPSVQSFAATLEACFVFAVGGIRLDFEKDIELSLVLFDLICSFFFPFHVKTTPMSGKIEVLIRGGKGTLLMMSSHSHPPLLPQAHSSWFFRLETVTTVSL